ncbi:type III glutamate--ammonia ligase [Halothiobacillus diazotrophicus]|uniref:Type III glutamate--ammonia ligase n=1 Tax=Halothiobacillus diazotrophicus TaxID=1860122 RepID=A0A191ZHW5_9GAMM|nr:type III glutamate--ammonia ligase [Halothiobacillus diazotrophicus]ANJ67486.1 type III glutamate--ammonia ligase [Halothiobacillus diazotrophicus]
MSTSLERVSETAVAEAHQRMAAAGVHTVIAQFVDIHGAAKGTYIPLAHLADIVSPGAGFGSPSIDGTGLPRHGPRAEFYGRGDLSTLKALPWMPGYARIVCEGEVLDEPHDWCARYLLRRQLARLAERGWTLNVGIEPEFCLFHQDAAGRPVPADPADALDKPSYDLKVMARVSDVLHRMMQDLETCGFDVFQIDHEDASGQFELNYHYSDALTAADRFVLFKMAAHHIAEDAGLIFSMMPKPFADRPGNGLHLHLSLRDETGRAVMADADDSHGLSETGRQCVAGLLAHARALTAFHAPSVNSYKRLVVGRSRSGTSWAPAHIAWGDNNRTSVLRTTGGRVEFRLTDGSCNIYLALASAIAAMLDGVTQGMQAPAPNDEDLYAWPDAQFAERGVATLPQTLGDALDALAADDVLVGALGAAFVGGFIDTMRMVWVDYCRSVSDWEYQRYLTWP